MEFRSHPIRGAHSKGLRTLKTFQGRQRAEVYFADIFPADARGLMDKNLEYWGCGPLTPPTVFMNIAPKH